MKDLVIIIVNYNVRYFLKQCLESIYNSGDDLNKEIFVVDNNSVDGSIEMLQEEFPKVKVIANKKNVGFGTANNQAFQISNSDFVLFLNPDTIISEDTIGTCYAFLQNDSEVGMSGVPMLDGKGNYLPESKRGLPSVWASFTKFSGLWRLFPKSKFFNYYYLGHLPKDQNHEVDVLSGAFMFVRRKVLDEVGVFDEQFFMYGEDVDLSYRIQKAGYKNYYLANTNIIHFKGESTKKSSVKYTSNFYQAMSLFVAKHHGKSSIYWSLFAQVAIAIVGLMSLFKKYLFKIIRPIIDLLLIFSLFQLICIGWSALYWNDVAYYNDSEFEQISFMISVGFVFIFYMYGLYGRARNSENFLLAWLFAMISLFVSYNFLPESYRFSRAIVLIGSISILPVLWVFHSLINKLFYTNSYRNKNKKKKVIAIGALDSIESIKTDLNGYFNGCDLISTLSPFENDEKLMKDRLGQMCSQLNPDELLFFAKDMPFSSIISCMTAVGNQYQFRIANRSNDEILGSDSKNTAGTWYASNINLNLTQETYQRQKRIFDVSGSIVIAMFLPLILLISPNRIKFLKEFIPVLFGFKTWVGYESNYYPTFPQLKSSVFHVDEKDSNTESNYRNVLDYVSHYSILKDFMITMKKMLPGKI